jgi:hypothetical protein
MFYLATAKRTTWATSKFLLLIKKFINFFTTLTKERSQSQTFTGGELKAVLEANKNLAWFITDLIPILDRGEILDMIHILLTFFYYVYC